MATSQMSFQTTDSYCPGSRLQQSAHEMYLQFEQIAATLKKLEGKQIDEVYLSVYQSETRTQVDKALVELYALNEGVDFDSGASSSDLSYSIIGTDEELKFNAVGWRDIPIVLDVAKIKDALANGVYLNIYVGDYDIFETNYGDEKPQITIVYSDPPAPKTTIRIDGNEVTTGNYYASEIDQLITWDDWAYDATNIWGTAPTVTAQAFCWGDTTVETALDTRQCTISAGSWAVGKVSIWMQATTSDGTVHTIGKRTISVSQPVISTISPSSGNAPNTVALVLTWDITQLQWDPGSEKNAAKSVAQSSAVITLKFNSSTATSEVKNGVKSRTFPAGTFSGSTLQWSVAVTTPGGLTATSATATLSTADVTSTAKAVSPSGTFVDVSKAIRFAWQHIISTGTAQTKAELQYSLDGSTWDTLMLIATEKQYASITTGAFGTGTAYWRVQTYNADGVAGTWSDAAEFYAIAAPTTPVVKAQDTSPRPTISWQTDDQEAYQVELDGALTGGTQYGSAKSWTSPAYLTDGSHTVRVRVQNKYGMWSAWGTGALTVSNTAGEAITLTVKASDAASLTWETSGTYDFFLVYRDGIAIAKTTGTQYTDELSTGATTYQVRGCYSASSNYGISTAVTATISTGDYATLYGISSGKKITLKHCGLDNQPFQDTMTRDVQYIFMYGATYPHVERSEFLTRKVGGTVVFLPGEDKAGFVALIGELVCLKTQTGSMIIGYLNDTSDTSRPNPDKSTISFSIQQIEYTEAIDIDS